MLGFSEQAFYAWKTTPVTDRDWSDACLINAALDVHRDDQAFGTASSPTSSKTRGSAPGGNRVARLCSSQRIWSVFAKKRGLTRKVGPPVHDDHVRWDFNATAPDQLWLTDITEHRTA
ncbi:UNVERIFIED_ORG: transposase InsO family protein [Arthrobacter sp. UYEF10]